MVEKKDNVRLDVWLWSVRLFKTRTIARDYCKKGRVIIDGNACKPSKSIKGGERIKIKFVDGEKSISVKGIVHKRVSAKLSVDLYEIIDI
jgi:ribosome-associated heat shock protein Hsp15